MPRTPAIAVASGPYVFIYRNLRPFFKFTVPSMEISETELTIWSKLKNNEIEVENALEKLIEARDNGCNLSYRSTEFLSYNDEKLRKEFVDR